MIDTYSFFVGLWSGFVMTWLIAGYIFVVRKFKREGGS